MAAGSGWEATSSTLAFVSGNLRCGPWYDASTSTSFPQSSGVVDTPAVCERFTAELALGVAVAAGWYARSIASTREMDLRDVYRRRRQLKEWLQELPEGRQLKGEARPSGSSWSHSHARRRALGGQGTDVRAGAQGTQASRGSRARRTDVVWFRYSDSSPISIWRGPRVTHSCAAGVAGDRERAGRRSSVQLGGFGWLCLVPSLERPLVLCLLPVLPPAQQALDLARCSLP